jgi:hypothetical protein
VTEQDVNFRFKSAHENKDRDIDPMEAMQAICAWEELAEAKLEDFDKIRCCNGFAICSQTRIILMKRRYHYVFDLLASLIID